MVLQDMRADSYKKIASDRAKARSNEYSAGSTFPTTGGLTGYASSGVSQIAQGGSVSSGGSRKASDYVFIQGVTGSPVGEASIQKSQALASSQSAQAVAQKKSEYDEFKRLQASGVISQNERFISSAEKQRAYFQEQQAKGGVFVSAGVYNKFLYERKGAFPTESRVLAGGRVVSQAIPFLKKGEGGFIYSSSKQDVETYFSPFNRDLGSVIRGEKYQLPMNLTKQEGKSSFMTNFVEAEKGMLYDYPKSIAKGVGKIVLTESKTRYKGLPFPDFTLQSAEKRLNLFKDKDVQNVAILGVSYGFGAGAGYVFGFGRSALTGLASRGVIAQSTARYLPSTLGLVGLGAYGYFEGKKALSVAGSVSSREFGFYAGSKVAEFFTFTKGFKMGYGMTAFAKRESAIDSASRVATERIGFYTTKQGRSVLSEGRGNVVLKFYNDAGLQKYKMPLRAKNVEYIRYLEEPKATFFYSLKGNPKETFYSGVLLPSGKQFSTLKVQGGKFLVVDEVVPKGALLPKLTKGFLSRLEPNRRATKFDFIARETFKLGKMGNYVSVNRQNIPIKNPVYTLAPLSATTTAKSEVLDRTIQSDILISKGKFLGAKGEYSFRQESYLTAKTTRRGVSVETFGETGMIDVATGKTFPSLVVVKQELPFYRFVDYVPKQKTLFYTEKAGGNIKARLPTESAVYQESKIYARGIIGEPAKGAKLNIVRQITIGQFENAKYGTSQFPFLKNYATKQFKFKNVLGEAKPFYQAPKPAGKIVVEGYVSKDVLKALPNNRNPEGIAGFANLVSKNIAPKGDIKVQFVQEIKEIPVQKSAGLDYGFKYAPSPILQRPSNAIFPPLSMSGGRSESGLRGEGLVRTYSFSKNIAESRLSNVNIERQVYQPVLDLRPAGKNVLENRLVNVSELKLEEKLVQKQVQRQVQINDVRPRNPRLKTPTIKTPPPPIVPTGFKFPFPSFGSTGKKRRDKSSRNVGKDKFALRVLPDLRSVFITEAQTSRLFGKSREATPPKLTRSIRRKARLAFGGFGVGTIPTEEMRTKRIKYSKFL